MFRNLSIWREQRLVPMLTSIITVLRACLRLVIPWAFSFSRSLVRNLSTLAAIVRNHKARVLGNLSITGKWMLITMLTAAVALLLACAHFVIQKVVPFLRKLARSLSALPAIIRNQKARVLGNLSITRKQMLITILTAAVALLLACAAFVIYDVISFRRSLVGNLSTLTAVIADHSTAALSFKDRGTAREILNSLRNEPHIVAACIYDRRGKVFANYTRRSAKGDLIPAAAPFPVGAKFLDQHVVLCQPIRLKGENVGTVFILSDLEELYDRLRRYRTIVIVVLFLSIVAALLISSRLQRMITRPILHLAATARQVSVEKNYSLRAVQHSQDELGQLILVFNEMLAQIQARDAALQTAHDELEKRVEERTQELKGAYAELRQSQQAAMQQERLCALGQMASGIAHDINNALCPVAAYSELLLETESDLTPAGRQRLQHIKTAGDDIAQVVSRMREFYRRREEKDQLVPVGLNQLADDVIGLTRPRWQDIAQARGVTIELRTDFEEKLPKIIGDKTEIREAITNLVLNSVDAMPRGGQLTLRTKSCKWYPGRFAKTGATHVTLEVCDTGIGMDEQTHKRCLEPFFTTKGQRGTGLGLAMVYGIMERHDGRIEIDSRVGCGTTIRLIFPISSLRSKGAVRARRAPVSLPPLRILCVDDEPLLGEMLREILERHGHQVEVGDSGHAGIERFRAAKERRQAFDVVVTDLGMPNMDGRQLAKTLKTESPSTPVIMLTGWGTMMKEDGDLPAEVDGVLSKPARVTELLAMFGKVLSKKAA